jgi:PAS domain S-box-containing protein
MKRTRSRAQEDKVELHAEQVRMLYAGAPTAALVNAVNASILTFLLWDVIPHPVLQKWLGVMCLIQVLRLTLARFHQRLTQPGYGPVGLLDRLVLRAARWEQWYLAAVIASGLTWGAAGFWLFPGQSALHQLALSFVLGGMAAGATAVLAPLRWAFPVYALSVLLPLSMRFFLEGTPHYLMMGTLTVIFLLVLLGVAYLIHSTIVTSIRLRLDNKDLVAALSAKAEDLRRVNQLLRTEVHEHAQTADQIRDRSFFLQQLIDAIPNPVFYKSLDGVYQGCNDAMAKFFGISKTGIAGKTVFDIVSRESAEEHARQDRELLDRGGVHAYESDVIASGGLRHVLFQKTVLRDPLGRPIGILGTLIDLTDRDRATAR